MLRYVYSRDTIVISTASDMYNNVYRGTNYNKLKKTIKPQSHQWENRNMNYDSVQYSTAINPASSNKVNLS